MAFDEQKIKLRLKEKERKKKEKEVLILVVHDGVVKSPFIKAECSKNFNHGEIWILDSIINFQNTKILVISLFYYFEKECN